MAAPAAPAPPTRAAYLQSVVRLLQTPDVITRAELCALPRPADLPDPLDVNVLHCKGRTLFSRLYFKHEDTVFRFILDADQAATHEIADALDFVLRCSQPHPTRDQFLATAPGDHSRLQQCCDIRVVFQSSGPWMDALHAVLNYIQPLGASLLPSDDVIAAWRIVAFDRREPAREELLRRRVRQATKVHVEQLFQAPPGVGRPNAADVKLYFDHHAMNGTEEEMATLFVLDMARSRERLVNELRARFPGWEPDAAAAAAVPNLYAVQLRGPVHRAEPEVIILPDPVHRAEPEAVVVVPAPNVQAYFIDQLLVRNRVAAPGPPLPTRASYMQSVVRLLQSPEVLRVSEQIRDLPLPADVRTAMDVDELHRDSAALFERLYCRHEDTVFSFISADQAVATDKVVSAFDFVMRCRSQYNVMIAQFLASADSAERLGLCCTFRDTYRSNPEWVDALRIVQAYIHAPSINGPLANPSAAAIDAWNVIAFDMREGARAVLLQRRMRQLVKLRMRELLNSREAPAPGRPTEQDVEGYFEYRAFFGTDEEMATLFVFDLVVDRACLVHDLRIQFPWWEPQQQQQHVEEDMVEAYDEQKLAAMHPGWVAAGEDFDHHARGYLICTLDTKEDRLKALTQLVEAHGARVTPLLVFDVFDLDKPDDDDPDRVRQQFSLFIRTIWEPRVQPSRDAIVQCAAAIYRARGNAIRAVFLFAAVPYLVHWPCEADTAFLGALLNDIPSDRERTETLGCLLEDKVPEGAQHMSYQDIHQFLDPLFQRLPDNHERGAAAIRYIQTWSIPISDAVRDHLMLRTTQSQRTRSALAKTIDEQRIRAKSTLSRKRARDARYASHIQDAVAPEDAPDDATCVACRSNLRRVCFVPCGHIVACIACAAQCNNKCPMCRAPIVHSPPCIVPITSSAPAPSPAAPAAATSG